MSSEVSTILILFLLAAAFMLLIRRFNSVQQYETKPSAMKKEEVIQAYENEIKELIDTYGNDQQKLLEEKKKMIKRINNELKMNLFFDDKEAKEVIDRLLKVS
ncbi:MAG: hypothetical protein ACQERD_09450 [Campylobacterota bacterium]